MLYTQREFRHTVRKILLKRIYDQIEREKTKQVTSRTEAEKLEDAKQKREAIEMFNDINFLKSVNLIKKKKSTSESKKPRRRRRESLILESTTSSETTPRRQRSSLGALVENLDDPNDENKENMKLLTQKV